MKKKICLKPCKLYFFCAMTKDIYLKNFKTVVVCFKVTTSKTKTSKTSLTNASTAATEFTTTLGSVEQTAQGNICYM